MLNQSILESEVMHFWLCCGIWNSQKHSIRGRTKSQCVLMLRYIIYAFVLGSVYINASTNAASMGKSICRCYLWIPFCCNSIPALPEKTAGSKNLFKLLTVQNIFFSLPMLVTSNKTVRFLDKLQVNWLWHENFSLFSSSKVILKPSWGIGN